MIFENFQVKTSQNRKLCFFFGGGGGTIGRVWGVQNEKGKEINTRNEELPMSRRTQYILKFSNSKIS